MFAAHQIQRVQVERKTCNLLVAIDTSGSMAGSRIKGAQDGTISILNALSDGDRLNLITFNNEVSNLTEGYETMDASSKAKIASMVRGVKAGGQTALHDVLLAASHSLLVKSAELQKLSHVMSQLGAPSIDSHIGQFWLVILTDGDDTSSKSSFEEAVSVLLKMNAVLRKLNLLKIMIIGVKLDSKAERKMQILAQAGGDTVEYRNVQDDKGIRASFNEIAIRIQQLTIGIGMGGALGGQPSALEWSGEIQKGTRVRVVETSRGAGGINIGDVGIVHSRDGDGDYRINFVVQDGWCARPSDVVVDYIAEAIRPGQRVRVKPSITSLRFGGSLGREAVGFVTKVHDDGKVEAEFGFSKEWTFQIQELEPVFSSGTFGQWPGVIQCGSAVRVKKDVSTPTLNWGSVKAGDVGLAHKRAKASDQRTVIVVDFPRADDWKGMESELEVDPVADQVRPGAQVRVKPSVQTPGFNWGSCSHASRGEVAEVRKDGVVTVCFPEDKTWKCHLNELELTSPANRYNSD